MEEEDEDDGGDLSSELEEELQAFEEADNEALEEMEGT